MKNPIIPWLGGKRRLAERLLPYFPPHPCYVEPFAGGAAMFNAAADVLGMTQDKRDDLFRFAATLKA